MVTESGSIHGDLSSGKSAKYNQVILVQYKISLLTDLLLGFFFERKEKQGSLILKLTESKKMYKIIKKLSTNPQKIVLLKNHK